MEENVNLHATYVPSDDVVAREISGEIVIVPLVAGMADMEVELFALNEAGKSIWDKLDGKKPLKDLVEEFTAEFDDLSGDIEKDVIGFVAELLRRRILVEVPGI